MTLSSRPELAFASPRKLPRPRDLKGRVVVLDVAFASEAASGGFEKVTLPFIEQLGSRLAGWVDHHDHVMHERYRGDPRFVLSTKAEHGACPEMVTAEVVRRAGHVDTVVCHTDFDGLCSAAKWLRGGTEPYPGADDDARAIDTRTGTPGPIGQRFDRALRARPRDQALFGLIVRHLAGGLKDGSLWAAVDEAASELAAIEEITRRIASGYVVVDAHPKSGAPASIRSVAFVDATSQHGRYDKTQLLLARAGPRGRRRPRGHGYGQPGRSLRQRRELPRDARSFRGDADAGVHPEEAPARGFAQARRGGRGRTAAARVGRSPAFSGPSWADDLWRSRGKLVFPGVHRPFTLSVLQLTPSPRIASSSD